MSMFIKYVHMLHTSREFWSLMIMKKECEAKQGNTVRIDLNVKNESLSKSNVKDLTSKGRETMTKEELRPN